MRQKEAGTIVSDVRRRNMQAAKGKNTQAEMAAHRLLHEMGYRYRLHEPRLPNRPDLAFPPRRAVIEVRVCCWHRHPDPACRNAAGQNAYQTVRSRSTDVVQVGFGPEHVQTALKPAFYRDF
jgi:DNA mismatch endonuclease Vsr